jgi:apolipoprotein D and lipocalin family protein
MAYRTMLRPLMLALALVGCAGTPSADAPRTVAAVDLGRYLGTWYEIARLPMFAQDGPRIACEEVTATYTARPGGRIGVLIPPSFGADSKVSFGGGG